jgi:hypothetical protein
VLIGRGVRAYRPSARATGVALFVGMIVALGPVIVLRTLTDLES